jgi:predicted lipase
MGGLFYGMPRPQNFFLKNQKTIVIFVKNQIMTKQQAIKIFENKKIRTIWNEDQEVWCFSIRKTIPRRGKTLITLDCRRLSGDRRTHSHHTTPIGVEQ